MNKSEFFVVVIITLIVGAIWGASEFIHSKNASIPNPTAKEYLADPVDPTFDQDTLSKINQLETPNPSAVPVTLTIKTSASPSATPRTTPRPSASPLSP